MISGGLLQQTAYAYEIASTDDLGHNDNDWNLVGSFRNLPSTGEMVLPLKSGVSK